MFIYAANWKMNMSFDQGIDYCEKNYKDFVAISESKDKKIVLFPEFTQIKSVQDIFHNSSIFVGAQDCSSSKLGAFTGQVPVESLSQIWCKYCIVGHSEVREFRQESNQELALKILKLADFDITPILCVGETQKDFLAKNHNQVIIEQLEPVLEIIEGYYSLNNGINIREQELFIAYEPVFAIGTGVLPEVAHIEEVFDIILQVSRKFGLENKIKLMYGGSVDEKNAKTLKNIKNLNGFLMGTVSLDFKKFKKIVEL